jgi:hypothetical protein
MRGSSSFLRSAGAAWIFALMLSSPSEADSPWSLRVEADGRNLGVTPMVVEANDAIKPGSYALLADGRKSQWANVFRDQGKSYLATVLETVPLQGRLAFRLDDRPTPQPVGSGVEMTTQGSRIEVRVDGKLVTEYIPDDGPKPYYFPLVGPSGATMTRAFPIKKVEGEKFDHPHHRSLWFTHGSVNKVDFWSEAPGHGRIVETSRPTVIGGLAMGLIRTTDDWLAPDGKKVCEDERVLRIYVSPKERMLDFDFTLKATEGAVTFGDTKEGMFGLRVATSMDVTSKGGGRIVNAEGVEDKAAWGKPSPWVDYSGPINGKTVGISILNHSSSFRYPTTWHVRDYGLFAANPFGWHDFGQKTSGEFVLPKGESIRFRYRVILHDGEIPSGLPSAFHSYVDPPKAVFTD